MSGYNPKTKPLVMNPIFLCRSEKEKCLIEPSINSVRISFSLKQNDEMDSLIAEKFSRYLQARADQLSIVRRKAIKVYSILIGL